MSWTTPPTFNAGDPLAAADLNVLGDDLVYLKAITDGVAFSGVQVKRTATQNVSSGSWTTISWQTESGGFDYGGWWSSGTNIVVPSGAIPSGFTTIACTVRVTTNYSSNGTGTRFLRILVNGSETEKASLTAISGDVTSIDCEDFVVVAAGDIITAEAYQSSGSTLTLSSSNTKITVVRFAPVA